MGIHPGFSTFEQRSADLGEARRALWGWAEPIIIDRAVEAYAREVDHAGTVTMARKHCRLWRNVILDQTSAVPLLREELRRAADSLGLADSKLDEVDDLVLEEMVDIVMCRYRSSRNAIKTFSLVLMSATSRLGTLRAAA